MPDITGSAAIDTAVGLFFIFFILSIICSAIVEAIANVFKLRARDLERGIRNLLEDPSKVTEFFNNPRIRRLGSQGWFRDHKPSYIPARAFALTFLDTVAPTGAPGEHNLLTRADGVLADAEASLTVNPDPTALTEALTAARADVDGATRTAIDGFLAQLGAEDDAGKQAAVETVRTQFPALEGNWPPTKRASFERVMALFRSPTVVATLLRDAVQSARDATTDVREQVAHARESLERSFDETMDRVSGWYKRRTQLILLIVALLVAGVANADSLELTQRLYKDDALRAAVVAKADDLTDPATCPPAEAGTSDDPGSAEGDDPLERATECVDALESLGLPFGWSAATTPDDAGGIAAKVIGLLLTVAALSLGAPFWFDLLGKLAQLRGVGNREGTMKTGSAAEDRDDPSGFGRRPSGQISGGGGP